MRYGFELVRVRYQDGSTFDLDKMIVLQSAEAARDTLPRRPGKIGKFFVGEAHGETHFAFSATRGAAPIQQNGGNSRLYRGR